MKHQQHQNQASLNGGVVNHGTAQSDMVLIPQGRFLMGSDVGGDFEGPAHEVLLDDFYIDRYLVTNAKFAEFVEDTGHVTTAERRGTSWGYQNDRYCDVPNLNWRSYNSDDRANHPVVLVSWNDAAAYADWAGKRLPTEAEWEKVARGGFECATYPWGDREPMEHDAGFAQAPKEIPPTSDVGAHAANGFDVFGIVGNVWQWCSDFYGDDYYQISSRENPQGPESGDLKVRRGGSWNVIQNFRLRCANRGAADPNTTAPNMGFRCAKSIGD